MHWKTNLTPVHLAVPMAHVPHDNPFTCLNSDISALLLPAHWIVVVMVTGLYFFFN